MSTCARAVRAAVVLGALGGLGALAAIAAGERGLEVTEHEVDLPLLPSALDGARILQISDLHDTRFGPGDVDLIAAVASARADLIVLTGDILDRGTTELGPLLDLAAHLTRLAPVLAVTGNHEGGTPLGAPLLAGLERAGVRVLRDKTIEVPLRGATLRVAGIDDPRVHGGPPSRPRSPGIDRTLVRRSLEAAGLSRRDTAGHPGPPTLLLAHRPELLAEYDGRGVDLVLAGHAHGGQWRLPRIGGLYAPGQGLLPRLTAGIHEAGTTRMLVSRGLKVRTLKPRLNNPPEIVAIRLRRR